MSCNFRLPSAVPPKRPSVCVSRSLQSGNRRLVSPFGADFRRRAPGRACRRVGHPSFFQRGFIQRGRPGVSGRGQEAPREPVSDDAGAGRPAASPCRLSSTGIPTAACRRGRAARTTAASPPRRTGDGSSSGPAHGSEAFPPRGRRPQPQSEHQGHDIQTNAARGPPRFGHRRPRPADDGRPPTTRFRRTPARRVYFVVRSFRLPMNHEIDETHEKEQRPDTGEKSWIVLPD